MLHRLSCPGATPEWETNAPCRGFELIPVTCQPVCRSSQHLTACSMHVMQLSPARKLNGCPRHVEAWPGAGFQQKTLEGVEPVHGMCAGQPRGWPGVCCLDAVLTKSLEAEDTREFPIAAICVDTFFMFPLCCCRALWLHLSAAMSRISCCRA